MTSSKEVTRKLAECTSDKVPSRWYYHWRAIRIHESGVYACWIVTKFASSEWHSNEVNPGLMLHAAIAYRLIDSTSHSSSAVAVHDTVWLVCDLVVCNVQCFVALWYLQFVASFGVECAHFTLVEVFFTWVDHINISLEVRYAALRAKRNSSQRVHRGPPILQPFSFGNLDRLGEAIGRGYLRTIIWRKLTRVDIFHHSLLHYSCSTFSILFVKR